MIFYTAAMAHKPPLSLSAHDGEGDSCPHLSVPGRGKVEMEHSRCDQLATKLLECPSHDLAMTHRLRRPHTMGRPHLSFVIEGGGGWRRKRTFYPVKNLLECRPRGFRYSGGRALRRRLDTCALSYAYIRAADGGRSGGKKRSTYYS